MRLLLRRVARRACCGSADRSAQAAFTAALTDRIATEDRDGTVEFFLTGCGVPEPVITGMRAGDAWPAMTAVAHTLVYDSMVSEAISAPLLASVTVPTLVLDSSGSPGELTAMAATAAGAIPGSFRRTLPGDWHGVPDDVLAPVLTEFFQG